MSRRAGAGICWTTCACPGRSPRGETSPARRSSPTVEQPWCGCVAATRRTRPDRMPSDRALQDDVIRALADAPYRGSADWRRRELADPDRVERYARFLARHFYYERIVHFFKYSRALAPETVAGTVLLELAYDLPAVLPKLLQPWTEVPQALERPTRLLVARSPHGRVAVARSDASVAAVIERADGRRTLEELAAGAGLQVAELRQTLQGLVDLGAVRFSTGS